MGTSPFAAGWLLLDMKRARAREIVYVCMCVCVILYAWVYRPFASTSTNTPIQGEFAKRWMIMNGFVFTSSQLEKQWQQWFMSELFLDNTFRLEKELLPAFFLFFAFFLVRTFYHCYWKVLLLLKSSSSAATLAFVCRRSALSAS